MWVVQFKDGDALACEALVIGPVESWDEAYDLLCMLPAPRPGGFKFVEELCKPDWREVFTIIADQRDARAQEG